MQYSKKIMKKVWKTIFHKSTCCVTVSSARFILETDDPSGRTWARKNSSSNNSTVYKRGQVRRIIRQDSGEASLMRVVMLFRNERRRCESGGGVSGGVSGGTPPENFEI